MIHGILEDANGFYGLALIGGLIKYNPKTLLRMLIIMPPVCRWASLDDAIINVLIPDVFFFGGIDGLLYLDNGSGDSSGIPIRTYYCVSFNDWARRLIWGIIIPMVAKR